MSPINTTETPTTVLITGSYGPLATRLAQDLEARGYAVHTLLAHEYSVGSAHVLSHQHANLAAPTDLAAAAETADVILMMTGLGPVAALVADAESLDVVLARARPDAVLIHTSSLAVLHGEGDLDETSEPLTPDYAATQRVLEQRVATATDWLRAITLRPGLVYTAGGGPLIDEAITQARATGVSRYLGDPGDRYPTVHEDDLLSLFRLLIEDPSARGVYHGASGSITAGELAQLIADRADVSAVQPWDLAELSEAVGMDVDPDATSLNVRLAPSRAITDLGWNPTAPDLPTAMT
ncbi:MAG: sugar nucleotide-binding protein [Ornithinimicrobium sp.]